MSSRVQRMKTDIQAVIAACSADVKCPFQNFEAGSDWLTFCFVNGSKTKTFSLHLSDDYPEHTILSRSDQPNQTQVVNDAVPVIFNNIARDHYKEMQILVKPSSEAEPMDASTSHEPLNRMISEESNYTDASSGMTSDDCEDYDYNDYYNDEGSEDDEESPMHPLLASDMELVKAMYGEHAISTRLFGAIDDIDVELNIAMSFLDPEIAKAWKVVREEPVTVRLHLSLSRYLDATEPKVEVFQNSQTKFGIGSQLKKIMETFISTYWRTLCNEDVLSQRKVHPRFSRQNSSQQSKKRPYKDVSPGAATNKGCEESVDDYSLAKIMELGFTASMARNALIITRGDVEHALNLLVSSPDGFEGDSGDGDKKSPNKGKLSVPPRPNRQHSYPKTNKDSQNKNSGKNRTTVRQKSISNSVVDMTDKTPLDDLNLMPTSTTTGKNSKQIPSLDHGYLVQVMQYARQRLPTLNEYCVVCDESHVFQNGAMLKPAVCSRELCVFAFQTLGVMSDAAEDIATGAEVVDLLVAMAKSACKSNRKETIFDPFPTIVDPLNPAELALHPKKKDFKRAERCLDAFIPMSSMTAIVGSAELKKELDAKDPLSYILLQWIISSNRSHIVKLPPEKQISFMHTTHQFLLMSSPPAKEAIFRQARKQHGSTFAFHGSNMENWHAIMRMGLINASGTKLQVHGAAYGKGIYLSPHASVSFGYSGMGYGQHKPTIKDKKGDSSVGGNGCRFLKSKNLTCIALCEVITHKDLKKNGNIWVMPNPDHVCTRFFFVYEDGQVGDSNIDTQVEKYKREIMKAVGYQSV